MRTPFALALASSRRSEVGEGDPHRRRELRRVGSLELDAYPAAVPDHQQVELRARVGRTGDVAGKDSSRPLCAVRNYVQHRTVTAQFLLWRLPARRRNFYA